jgi:hypothetical protein
MSCLYPTCAAEHCCCCCIDEERIVRLVGVAVYRTTGWGDPELLCVEELSQVLLVGTAKCVEGRMVFRDFSNLPFNFFQVFLSFIYYSFFKKYFYELLAVK